MKPVIQRNAFYAHPENLLLKLLTDEDAKYRNFGMSKISKVKTDTIRTFQILKLNFEAKHYSELINWPDKIAMPPLLKSVEFEIKNYTKLGQFLKGFLCHT